MGRQATPTGVLWLLTAVFGATAIVLGLIGFAIALPKTATYASASWSDYVYYTLQLFVFDSAPLQTPIESNGFLEVARFLAPLTTLLAVIQAVLVLLGDLIERRLGPLRTGHVVVVGDAPVAPILAQRLAAERRVVVLISSEVSDEFAERHRVRVVAGDPADEQTLRAAGIAGAHAVYACAQNSARNAAVALVTRKLARRSVVVYAQVTDGELATALRARRLGVEGDGGYRLDFFAIDDLAARALLDEHPPTTPDGSPAQVVIVGFGTFARAVLRALSRRSAAPAARPVTVVSPMATAVRTFGERLGIEVDPQAEIPDTTSQTRLYVCLDTADDTLRAGLGQVRSAAGRVVMCLGQQSAFRDALTPASGQVLFDDARGRLAVFGIMDAACDPASVRNDLIDQLGRALHERYLENSRRADLDPTTHPHLTDWHLLPPEVQQDNHSQAEHIGVKLNKINAVLVPAAPDGQRFSYRENEVERLAIMEHERWMRQKARQFVVFGPVRQGNQHPDMVAWADLHPASKKTDLDFIEYLPELLARAGFDILRL